MSVLLPLLHAQLVASHGVALPFSSVSTNASGSYTWPMVTPSPRLPGLNGLKLQFHCVPCSLEIVSVPLGPLAEVAPDDPDDAEDLQAATAAASSAAAPVTISVSSGLSFTDGLVRVGQMSRWKASSATNSSVTVRRLYRLRSMRRVCFFRVI